MSWNPLCHLEGKYNYPVNQQCAVKSMTCIYCCLNLTIRVSIWRLKNVNLCSSSLTYSLLITTLIMALQDSISTFRSKSNLGCKETAAPQWFKPGERVFSGERDLIRHTFRHSIDLSKRNPERFHTCAILVSGWQFQNASELCNKHGKILHYKTKMNLCLK